VTSADARRGARLRGLAGSRDPVLIAKITMPDIPDWGVRRPRIEKLIAEGARGPLTTVTGPPGAGKTMAIASWAATTDYPCCLAWITLDSYDNRPKVFWSYLVAALRQAGIALPGFPAAPTRATAGDHLFLLRLASALAAQDPPMVMVLDDLHLVTEPVIIDGLAYVLRNAMPGLHLVVSSRMDPLLPLHRYRLAGKLAEIRADDLAFSVSEASLLLAHHDISLSPAGIECLTARTEGWAAGMRLAALSLDGHPDPDQFVKELGAEDSAVTSYLVDEVLNAQPPSVRDLLLRTSILDCVNADLASELTDDQRAADELSALVRENAFIRPIGHGWYRYHSLFAGVLRLKLRSEDRGRVSDLHRRAALWYQRRGRLTEAVRYAANSGDWPLAARIVVDGFAIGQLIEPWSDHALVEAFRPMLLDPAWSQPHPLLVTAAIELSDGTGDLGDASLTDAEGLLERVPAEDEIPARLAAALIRMTQSRRTGNIDVAADSASRAESLMAALPEGWAARHTGIRAEVMTGRGVAELLAGHLDEATGVLGHGVTAACGPDDGYERADCLGYLALAEVLRGRLSRAAELAGEAASAARASGGEVAAPIVPPAASVALAFVHMERNEPQVAHSQLKLADAALRVSPDRLISAVACLIAAERRLAQGHATAAGEMISSAQAGWSPPGWLDLKLALLESRACAAAGDVQAAVAVAGRAAGYSAADAAIALAHAWLVSGDPEAASRALEVAPDGPAVLVERAGLAGWLADARLSYETGKGARGRRSLEHALRLGRPERRRLPFALERSWIRPVLRRCPDLASTYRELLEPEFISPSLAAAAVPQALMDPATPPIIEPLSQREREVLAHLSEMLSTAEIANDMYISVNTVKTHLRSIYRKLSAAHRGEAVRRARQLQLI
jgi:LuxR family transcriptional regulator, maltose regulon positive regulatory protein